jgi:RNA ligase (TIGR02306 family)
MSATVVKIIEINPIPDADRIELATVLGWNVIIGKSENFAVGDLAIYYSISSIPRDTLPGLVAGKPIKTLKMRGVLSQGYLTKLPQELANNVKEGDDVTEILGVRRHYEVDEIDVASEHEHKFPEHLVSRTEQARIQNYPWMINKLMQMPIRVTIKYDGTSSTYIKTSDGGLIYSRNQAADKPGSVYFNIAQKYNIFEKMPVNLAIQGEICGPKIQKNKLGLSEIDFFVFDIFDTAEQKYLDWSKIVEICNQIGLKTVALVGLYESGSQYFPTENVIKTLIQRANETKYVSNNTLAEGFVVTQNSPVCGRDRVSFKVISNEFLLKYKL